jgi:hypothetical protein
MDISLEGAGARNWLFIPFLSGPCLAHHQWGILRAFSYTYTLLRIMAAMCMASPAFGESVQVVEGNSLMKGSEGTVHKR